MITVSKDRLAEERNITTDTDSNGNVIGYTWDNEDGNDRTYRYVYHQVGYHADYPIIPISQQEKNRNQI